MNRPLILAALIAAACTSSIDPSAPSTANTPRNVAALQDSIGITLNIPNPDTVALGVSFAIPVRVDLSRAGTTTVAALTMRLLTTSRVQLQFDSVTVAAPGWTVFGNTINDTTYAVAAFSPTALPASGNVVIVYATVTKPNRLAFVSRAVDVVGTEDGNVVTRLVTADAAARTLVPR
jgi:hypothetical protein